VRKGRREEKRLPHIDANAAAELHRENELVIEHLDDVINTFLSGMAETP
jgi:hypothetical protein